MSVRSRAKQRAREAAGERNPHRKSFWQEEADFMATKSFTVPEGCTLETEVVCGSAIGDRRTQMALQCGGKPANYGHGLDNKEEAEVICNVEKPHRRVTPKLGMLLAMAAAIATTKEQDQ